MSILVSGCSHNYKVTIIPEIMVPHAKITTFQTVEVKVVDLRPEKKIYSENRFGLDDVSIASSAKLEDTIRDKVMEVLSLLNFKPNSFDVPNSSSFKLEILSARLILSSRLKMYGSNLRYKHEMDVVFKVICSKKGIVYENLYQAIEKNEHGISNHAGEFFSGELINAGISKALQKVFNDKNLLTFLAEWYVAEPKSN